RIVYPSTRTVDYAFDFADRPIGARSGSSIYVSAATYLPFGPLKDVSFGNGTTRTATFDQRYQPSEFKLANSTATLADHVYQLDGSGNVTQLNDSLNATYNRTFTYDDLNRVKTATTGSSLWGAGSYSYDAMGNVKTLALGSSRTATLNYVRTTPLL